MPKFNQSQVSFTLNTKQQTQHESMKGVTGIPLMKSNNQMTAVKKIPPEPPKRKIFRSDPEGMPMPVIIEFNEKKNVQMTNVATPTITTTIATNSKPRVPPKPLITFVGGQQQRKQQQNLLNSNFVASPNSNLNNNTAIPTNLYQIHSNVIHTNHRTKQQISKQQYYTRNGGKSDPENHIYEMIDDYENKTNCNLQQMSSHRPTIDDADETKERMNMFQDLLRAEMMNQMKSCSKKLNTGGFLSHLTQEKRMDIIQETALSIASATYLEK
jgi:hypothetical protein